MSENKALVFIVASLSIAVVLMFTIYSVKGYMEKSMILSGISDIAKSNLDNENKNKLIETLKNLNQK